LQPPHWQLSRAALEAVINPNTRLMLFNTPHNPTGAVLSRSDVEMLAGVLRDHPQIIALCDEVYEHLVFGAATHVPLLSLPDMQTRALKIGSAGKSFSLTGWKVGYVCGDPALIDSVARAHQFLTFTTPPNLQAAVAFGLRKEASYFEALTTSLQNKRDHLSAALIDIGFDVLPCAGTYFLTAGYDRFSAAPAMLFAQQLVREAKVATIPYDPFYADPEGDAPPQLIRFCFAKQPAVLDSAIHNLRQLL
jgi:N-succinyldiaminopimelate aminotransferase